MYWPTFDVSIKLIYVPLYTVNYVYMTGFHPRFLHHRNHRALHAEEQIRFAVFLGYTLNVRCFQSTHFGAIMCFLCPLVSGLWMSLCTKDDANNSVLFLLACIHRWWPGHVLHLQRVFSVLGTYRWALVRSALLKHNCNVLRTQTWNITNAKSWRNSSLWPS